jgi:DNA-binding transcriptional MerR regulator
MFDVESRPRMPENRFTTRDVLSLTGATARQLQWWDERKIVIPAREGRNRIYSATDLVDILVIEQMRRRRISLAQVRRVLRLLRVEVHARLADLVGGKHEYHLLLDGRRIYLETDSRQIIDLLRNSKQPMLLISLTDAVKPLRVEIGDLLAKLPAARPAERVARRTERQRAIA